MSCLNRDPAEMASKLMMGVKSVRINESRAFGGLRDVAKKLFAIMQFFQKDL
jgi:hypothetical protein